jgi:hypothetical protein
MKATKSVISALLGVSLLAVPITAAAHPHDGDRNRGHAPAYHQAPAYRSAVAPRANFGANFTPRAAANNRLWMAPTAPMVAMRDRDDWRWRDRDRDDYRNVPPYNPYQSYNPYPNSYGQGYYPEAYNNAPPYYGASVGGGLANLIRQRDNAQILYQQALRSGNRVRAKHLRNDIIGLNKSIGNTRTRGGYGPAYGSFNNPLANTNSNGYGYGNSNLDALAGPLLRNFIP